MPVRVGHRRRGRSPGAVEQVEAWDQQPGETARAYRAFLVYRDLGPSRSLAKVRRECGIQRRLVERWSARWGWVERVRAWERAERLHDEAVRREARQKAIREMEERHVAIAKGMQAQLIQRLQTLRAEELTPSTMAQMFDVAVKVERLALGAATARVDAEPPAESYFESAIVHAVLASPEAVELLHQALACLEDAKTPVPR